MFVDLFDNVFCIFLNFCTTLSYITSLPADNSLAVTVDIGIAFNPNPVRDNVIELDVVAMMTIVSNDFNAVLKVLCSSQFFSDWLFLSLNYVIISLLLFFDLLKLFTTLCFFSKVCSKSKFFSCSGADGFNLSAFWSSYIA